MHGGKQSGCGASSPSWPFRSKTPARKAGMRAWCCHELTGDSWDTACSDCLWHLDGHLSPQTLSKVFSNSSDEDPGLTKHSKAGLTWSMRVIVLSCTMLDQDLGALTVGVCRHAADVAVFVWWLVLIWKQLSVLIFSPEQIFLQAFLVCQMQIFLRCLICVR